MNRYGYKTLRRGSAVVMMAVAVLPLVIKAVQSCGVQIMDSDSLVMHLVFLFAALAGIVTWRENKHLTLASFNEHLPKKARKAAEGIRLAVTVCVLTALLCDSLCQLVNSAQFTAKIWFVPERVFYLFLPLCYAAMLSMAVISSLREGNNRGDGHLAALALGLAVGLFASASPISGIIYYLTGKETLMLSSNAWLTVSLAARWPLAVILVLSAFVGTPIFIALAGVAYILFSQGGGYVDVIPLETYRILTDRNTAAIPLFTTAGYILSQGSAGKRFVSLFRSLFAPFKGGAVAAAVIVTTFFSTFTGVSGVTILALGSLLSAMLVGSGYKKDRAESLVTASGAIGLLFPPSAAIIMYATVNYFSVDVFDLFKAAILPGAIMALAMIATGVVFDTAAERPKFDVKEVLRAIKGCIPELAMPVLICLTYFKGVFDLFEVSSFAVVYAFILSAAVRRDHTLRGTLCVVADSVSVSGGVIFILGAATGVSYFILDADLPSRLTAMITAHVTSRVLFLILMNLALLVVGCLMDMFSAILIVSPLLLPLAESFGVSATQAAVIFLMNLSIGFLTPPVGMDLFISSYTFNKGVGSVVRGILPFLAVQALVLLLVTYVPILTQLLL